MRPTVGTVTIYCVFVINSSSLTVILKGHTPWEILFRLVYRRILSAIKDTTVICLSLSLNLVTTEYTITRYQHGWSRGALCGVWYTAF
jgi:hypothetical protein